MLPKRKLIKKPRSANKPSSIDQTEIQSPQSLIERLKSPIPQVKQQAISVIANLRYLFPQLLGEQFLREMINLLYNSSLPLCCEVIYAISNLCELQPQITRRIFALGLDKALCNLQSTTGNLLKPILLLFITVNDHLPKQYSYLIQGIRVSLSIEQLNHNTQLCLQFLYRTRSRGVNKLNPQVLNQLSVFYKMSESPVIKSYSIAILCIQLLPNPQVEELLISHLNENLVYLDLQKQYEINFPSMKTNVNKIQQSNNQDIDMEEDPKIITSKQQKSVNGDQQKWKYFQSAISGIEVFIQFILDLLDGENKDDQDWDEEEDQQQDEDMMQQQQQNTQNNLTSHNTLLHILTPFLHSNMPIFPKFLSLTAPQTENLVYLFYHLLLHTAKTLPQSPSTYQQINKLIEVSLYSLFSGIQLKKQSMSFEDYEVLVQCLEIGLGVVMKHKAIGVSDNFLIEFTKKYLLEQSIFHSPTLLDMLKPSWLIMLELFSLKFNPEKNPSITEQQNYHLGEILKYLIISLPYNDLQQFRCQAVDTVFDIYSNERFDVAFVKLGYFQILQQVVKKGAGVKEVKTKGKKNKREKFVVDVLKDAKRFLQYKHKMINK